MKTFEQYILDEISQGKIDFRFRASAGNGFDKHVHFYVHPIDRDGETADFKVVGNTLTDDPCIGKVGCDNGQM